MRLEIVKKLFDNKLMIIHRLIRGSIASVLIINSLSSLDAWSIIFLHSIRCCEVRSPNEIKIIVSM